MQLPENVLMWKTIRRRALASAGHDQCRRPSVGKDGSVAPAGGWCACSHVRFNGVPRGARPQGTNTNTGPFMDPLYYTARIRCYMRTTGLTFRTPAWDGMRPATALRGSARSHAMGAYEGVTESLWSAAASRFRPLATIMGPAGRSSRGCVPGWQRYLKNGNQNGTSSSCV